MSRRCALVALAVAQIVLVACGTTGPAAVTNSTATPVSPAPTPTITAKEGTLAWYLAHMPTFPAAPVPVKVKVPASDKAIPWYRVPTDQKVAFITIDDGQFADPLWTELIRTANIPITSSLTYYFVWKSGDYFLQLHPNGRGIHNHGKTHDNLVKFSYPEQKKDICQADDLIARLYFHRPLLFRPPYGAFNDDTRRAAHDCGHGLVIPWTQFYGDGKLRSGTEPIQPGDIILMHYRASFPEDLVAALQAISRAGLVPALLDDYIELGERASQRPSTRVAVR